MKFYEKLSVRNRAILLILLEALAFSLMTFFVKKSGDIPVMQKVFFRNFIATIVAVMMLYRSKEGFKFNKPTLPTLLCRCFFGSLGLIFNFIAIDRLPLADSNMLNKMAPFFTIIFSIIILKEIPKLFQLFCVILAFAGVAFVVKPTAGIVSMPALIGLAGGLFAGLAYTLVRKVTMNGERGMMVVMAFSLFSTIISIPFFIFDYHPMSFQQIFYLLLAGLAAAVAQLGLTAAYSLASAKEISIFDYSQIIFAAIFGFIFFGEIPRADSIIGFFIIFIAAIIQWRLSLREQQSKSVFKVNK